MKLTQTKSLLATLTFGSLIASGSAHATVIDDFTSDTLSPEWNQSVVLTQGAGATVTFDTTTNSDELTYGFSGANGNAQQVVLMRDDVTLTNPGDYVQTKVRLSADGAGSNLFMGVAIDEVSETPSNRDNLFGLFLDGDGRIVQQRPGAQQTSAVNAFDETQDWYLRITLVTPTSIQTSYSSDGVSFTNIHSARTITGVASVGYFTGNARSSAAGNTGIADDFTVVPEPGSLALLGLGGLCVLRRRRG
ncbi:MAG: PEP-CTERM sorting domain-containing protein [Planctomycetota bacterium]